MKSPKNIAAANARRPAGRLLGLVALFVCWGSLALATHAQSFQTPNRVDLITPEGLIVIMPVVAEANLAELTSLDLSVMNAAWWKSLRKQHTRLLRSSDEQVHEQALQNVIHFAKHYRDHIDFSRATSPLYEIYRSDENEAHRIMALAALHAIGNRSAMELVREDVSREKSEYVRHLTLLALADYFGDRKTQ